MRGQNQFALVASGSAVSETIPNNADNINGLWVPTVTSCQLFLQGSFDTTSANFVRIYDWTDPTTTWFFPTGVGSNAVPVVAPTIPFPYLRVELSVAQTDPRTIVLHQKL